MGVGVLEGQLHHFIERRGKVSGDLAKATHNGQQGTATPKPKPL